MSSKRISRRRFLELAASGAGAAVLASCAPKPTATPVPTKVPAKPTQVPPTPEPVATLRPGGWLPNLPLPPAHYDPTLEISQNFIENSIIKYVEGDSTDDNVWTRWFEEQMGIVYKPTWVASQADAVAQQWATTMASGDLPELMVEVGGSVLGTLYEADGLEDITDIWNEAVSPGTKAAKRDDDSLAWALAKKGGRIYGVPSCRGQSNDKLGWIRQDWLDKLGLEAPTTFDEVVATGLAFKQAGLAEIGLSVDGSLMGQGSVDFVFGGHGVMPTYWMQGPGGSLVNGSILPEVKDALGVLRQWYADGLIDPEFSSVGGIGAFMDCVAGKSGMVFGSFWAVNWPLPDTVANDPEARWVQFPVPMGPTGERKRAGSPITAIVFGFRKGTDPQKIEAVLKHLDWQVDRKQHKVEYRDYGFEGYDYKWEGDKIELLHGEWGPAMWLEKGAGGRSAMYLGQDPDMLRGMDMLKAKDPNTLNAFEKEVLNGEAGIRFAESYRGFYDTLDQQILNQYQGLLTPSQLLYGSDLQKLERETFQLIVAGQAPLSDFDEFVDQWKKQGGDKVTEEVNAAAASQ